MMRETARRLSILIVVPALLGVSVTPTRAQSSSVEQAASIQEAALRYVQRDQRPLHVNFHRRPCNLKRRALVGAAIGSVGGMVLVRKLVAEHGATIGARDTLRAGGVGAVIGALLGSHSCR